MTGFGNAGTANPPVTEAVTLADLLDEIRKANETALQTLALLKSLTKDLL